MVTRRAVARGASSALGGVALVVGDHAIGEPDERAELLLREPPGLAELHEARAEAIRRCLFACRCASHEDRERIERRRTQGL